MKTYEIYIHRTIVAGQVEYKAYHYDVPEWSLSKTTVLGTGIDNAKAKALRRTKKQDAVILEKDFIKLAFKLWAFMTEEYETQEGNITLKSFRNGRVKAIEDYIITVLKEREK